MLQKNLERTTFLACKKHKKSGILKCRADSQRRSLPSQIPWGMQAMIVGDSNKSARRVWVCRACVPRGDRSGFTLIDVLVTMSVIALLIGFLIPGLGKVREIARRVVCSSNIRQVGLGLVLYADANKDKLPNSVYINTNQQDDNEVDYSPESMMTLRLRNEISRRTNTTWDGLGLLFGSEILTSPEIFYCPSHHGNHPFENYTDAWKKTRGEIVGNYHFRGVGPNGSTRLSFIEPSRAAIAADGMRTIDDYNHRVGLNVLRADISLFWLGDPTGQIGEFLATNEDEEYAGNTFDMLWDQLDTPDENILPGR